MMMTLKSREKQNWNKSPRLFGWIQHGRGARSQWRPVATKWLGRHQSIRPNTHTHTLKHILIIYMCEGHRWKSGCCWRVCGVRRSISHSDRFSEIVCDPISGQLTCYLRNTATQSYRVRNCCKTYIYTYYTYEKSCVCVCVETGEKRFWECGFALIRSFLGCRRSVWCRF